MTSTSGNTRIVRTNKALLLIALIFLVLMFLLVLGLNVRRGLNHDEHQFIASGALLAADGRLPYVDYPYFHVPAQTFVYALLFRTNDHLLLTARLFSVICSCLSLALLFGIAITTLRNHGATVRVLFAAAIVVLLLASPLFVHASGRAWNHDFSILLALAAFWLHTQALDVERGYRWLSASGLLLGLAASTRLSFAPAAVPFLVVLWYGRANRRRLPALAAFSVGGAIGVAPALVALALAPDRFIFGNLTYPYLNLQYFRDVASTGATMSLSGKAYYFAEMLLTEPGNLLLTLSFLAALVPLRGVSEGPYARKRRFALFALPFLLMGALAPTPAQPQYFYALFPFMLLVVIYRVAELPAVWQRRGAGLLAVIAAAAALFALPVYGAGVQTLVAPDDWYPIKLHSRSTYLAELADGEHVLTLAPIYPLEGAAEVYPEFTTGSFAWRVAPLLSSERRSRFGLVAADELISFLEKTRRPRAILVDVHGDDADAERALVAYAKQHGYVPVALEEVGTLWLSPRAEWEGTIRLGGHTVPRDAVQPGDTRVVTFYLQNVAPIRRNLNVLVRVVGADGREIVRDEGWPWGAPTSTWQHGEVWPDGHELTIPADARPGYYRVEMSFYDPESLDPFGATATVAYLHVGDVTVPAARLAPPAVLGRRVHLLAADAGRTTYVPGTTVSVELFWQALRPLETNYTVFVHLVGPEGALVAQQDRQPLDGFYPTGDWHTHLPVKDRYDVTLPADAPTGTYTLYVGMYDLATGQRLPVEHGGTPAGDAVELTTVQVGADE